MSTGYRPVIIGAVVCVTSIAFGLGLYIGALNYPQKQQQAYLYTTDKPQEVHGLVAVRVDADFLEYREPCRDPKGQGEADLCAQWRSANAAEDSAFWAKWSFWIGLGGLVGLLVTLHYTRKAVIAAEDATKDAENALEIAARNADAAAQHVEVAEKVAQTQLRAYLSVQKATYDTEVLDEESDALALEVINNGQTPGRIIRIQVNADWCTAAGELVPLIRFDGPLLYDAHKAVPIVMPIKIDVPDNALLDEAGVMSVVGVIDYQDIFGIKRSEIFSFSSRQALDFWEVDNGYLFMVVNNVNAKYRNDKNIDQE